MMDRWRRRAEPACIDITWVSCRGVKSYLPFHTPCLYACIYLETPPASSPAGSKGSPSRRPHRVKTTTDRAGGENPEWDAPLRLYVPDAAAASPQAAEKEANWENGGAGAGLLVRFELKAEVAVLGDVLSASAAVPVSDLVADGATRRVSYQLAASDGRQRNGVISFSYAFHHHRAANDDGVEDDRSSVSDGEPVTPPCPATPRAITLQPPSPPPSSGTMYPVIDWSLTEQVLPVLYPPPVTADTVTVTGSRYYPSPQSPAKPVAVYPPPSPDTLGCGVYPAIREPEHSGMYPMVDPAPVTCYPPTAPLYGGGCGYAAPAEWDGRCLHYS